MNQLVNFARVTKRYFSNSADKKVSAQCLLQLCYYSPELICNTLDINTQQLEYFISKIKNNQYNLAIKNLLDYLSSAIADFSSPSPTIFIFKDKSGRPLIKIDTKAQEIKFAQYRSIDAENNLVGNVIKIESYANMSDLYELVEYIIHLRKTLKINQAPVKPTLALMKQKSLPEIEEYVWQELLDSAILTTLGGNRLSRQSNDEEFAVSNESMSHDEILNDIYKGSTYIMNALHELDINEDTIRREFPTQADSIISEMHDRIVTDLHQFLENNYYFDSSTITQWDNKQDIVDWLQNEDHYYRHAPLPQLRDTVNQAVGDYERPQKK